jgi:VTC domain
MSTAMPAARPAGGGSLERELKYVVPAGRALLARGIVSALCRPDAHYPAATVFTVYYDTPGLELLSEKINSDYLKTKVRLRWYSTPPLHGRTGTFLEIKSRVGTLRRKVRVETPLTVETLRAIELDDPQLQAVLDLSRSLGVAVPARLMPALLLRYERHRFVERFSGSRISVDTDVEALSGNPRLLGHTFRVRLPQAVVEAKGAEDALPRILDPLIQLGARRESFSKYAAAGLAMLRYTH